MKFVVLLGLFAIAASQRQSDSLEEAFRILDSNNDNFISLEELKGYLSNLDTDGDCVITESEWTASTDPSLRHTPEVQGPFLYYDKVDGRVDNHITCDDVSLLFDRLDTDGQGDGRLSLHEFEVNFALVEAEIETEIANLANPGVGK